MPSTFEQNKQHWPSGGTIVTQINELFKEPKIPDAWHKLLSELFKDPCHLISARHLRCAWLDPLLNKTSFNKEPYFPLIFIATKKFEGNNQCIRKSRYSLQFLASWTKKFPYIEGFLALFISHLHISNLLSHL